MIRELVTKSLEVVFQEQGLPPYQNGDVIYGFDGRLNSLALVRLIVELETRVQDEVGHTIILTDNSVLSAKNSPFHNIDSLVTFVEQKVIALET